MDRSTAWTQLSTLKLSFPTYHPEGLVVTADRFYLTSTQVLEPTQMYPAPVDGFMTVKPIDWLLLPLPPISNEAAAEPIHLGLMR